MPRNEASLFLSPQLQFLLEAQAVRERILSRDDYAFGEVFDVPPLYKSIPGRRDILPYVALYPDLRATRSDFALGRLAGAGLKVQVEEPGLVRHLNYVDWSNPSGDDEFVALLTTAHHEACELCLGLGSDLTNFLRAQVGPDQINNLFTVETDGAPGRCANLFTLLLPRILQRLRAYYATELTTSILHDELFFEVVCPDLDESGLLSHPYFEALLGRLDDFYTRIVAELFISSHEQAEFGTRPWFRRLSSRRPISSSDIGPVIKLLNIRFEDEIRILPAPRSLAEAAEMAQDPKIVRLRRKIRRWIEEAGPDKPALERRIRNDIAAASRDLRKLRAYREYKESPLVFAVKAVAGQIPLVGNVVSAAESLSWLGERWLERRSCWVTIRPH